MQSEQATQRVVRRWTVYVDGKFKGYVSETTEANARCAAITVYDIPVDAEFSVSPA